VDTDKGLVMCPLCHHQWIVPEFTTDNINQLAKTSMNNLRVRSAFSVTSQHVVRQPTAFKQPYIAFVKISQQEKRAMETASGFRPAAAGDIPVRTVSDMAGNRADGTTYSPASVVLRPSLSTNTAAPSKMSETAKIVLMFFLIICIMVIVAVFDAIRTVGG